MLSWASITPFGVPVVPEVKMSSNSSLGAGRGQAATWASQSAGNAVSGSAAMASIVVVGKASSPASRGSGASRPVPSSRPGFGDDAFDRLGRHPEIEGHEDQPGADGAEIDRRQLRRRGRPGENAVARLKAERAKAPCSDPGSAIELPVAPFLGRAVVAPDPDRGPIGEASDGVVEQVEQRVHGA
jgi:hypothetical protein